MKRTPQNSQKSVHPLLSPNRLPCAHRVSHLPENPIPYVLREIKGRGQKGAARLRIYPDGLHFFSAALRASATSRQHPSPPEKRKKKTHNVVPSVGDGIKGTGMLECKLTSGLLLAHNLGSALLVALHLRPGLGVALFLQKGLDAGSQT